MNRQLQLKPEIAAGGRRLSLMPSDQLTDQISLFSQAIHHNEHGGLDMSLRLFLARRPSVLVGIVWLQNRKQKFPSMIGGVVLRVFRIFGEGFRPLAEGVQLRVQIDVRV
ncbi:MAG TPA: hypothetical protein EYG57_16430 [Planctomycetes bacterium]|nr:hypothetical protein [Planctomycetota bacterium]